MADFPKALAITLAREGGYTNDPSDHGGETNYGITLRDAIDYGNYTGPMKDLPRQVAVDIYRTRYWDTIQGEKLPDQEIANRLFDAGVNIGTARVIRYLQRSLNVLNEGGKRWADIVPDGILGASTLEALAMALMRGPAERDCIVKCLSSLQCVYYIELSEHDPKFEAFTNGWIRGRV